MISTALFLVLITYSVFDVCLSSTRPTGIISKCSNAVLTNIDGQWRASVTTRHHFSSNKTEKENRFEKLQAQINKRVWTTLNNELPTSLQGEPNPRVNHKIMQKRDTSSGYGLSQLEKILTLYKHNVYRSQEVTSEGVANMEQMYWHDGLASMAQKWADECLWEHGGLSTAYGNVSWTNIGQNLHFIAGSKTYDPEYGVQRWYDEKPDYDYDSNGCSDLCGHYTQVVWGPSKYVGCAFHKCPILVGREEMRNWTNAHFFVCNYGPAGNYQGVRPYLKGDPCTKCSDGRFQCYQGLCRNCDADQVSGCECKAQCNCGTVTSNCTCECLPGWTGIDCSEKCEDRHENCGVYPGWPKWSCKDKNYGEGISRLCPALCERCVPFANSACKLVSSTTSPVTDTQTSPPGGISNTVTFSTTTNTVNQREHGFFIEILTDISKWTETWIEIKSILSDALNDYCKEGRCCKDGKITSFSPDDIRLGSGYPVQKSVKATHYEVMVIVNPSNQSCDIDFPQEKIYDAVVKMKENLNNKLTACCNTSILGIFPPFQPSEPPRSPPVSIGISRYLTECRLLLLLMFLFQCFKYK